MTFFNIFSKSGRKAQEIKKPIILVDNREKSSSVMPFLLEAKDIQLDFQQLPIADYIINGIAIERKTVYDFKSSIMNKRIFEQLENLQQHPKHLLILEGILDEDLYTVGMHENAFRGFMLSLALQYRVHIIFTHNAQDTAKYLLVLARKKEKSSPSIRPSRFPWTPEKQAQYILEGFPNIGPIKAQKLLQKFKSLKKIFNADEESLKPILGKRAKDFKALLEKI